MVLPDWSIKRGGLPATSSLRMKSKYGGELTPQEHRQIEGNNARKSVKVRPFPRGSYVKFIMDKGQIEGTVVNSDDEGNYLIQYSRDQQCLIRPKNVVRKYLVRQDTLIPAKEYVIGTGAYTRVVNTEGYITSFYDKRLEFDRVHGNEIILPDSELTYPNSTWGMLVKP